MPPLRGGIRSTLTRRDFQEIYRWFDIATPLPSDCGELCGKKCCSEWEKGVGMYLYPGEEVMFRGDEEWLTYAKHSTDAYEFCPQWQGEVTFIVCEPPCPRAHRPVECRTFPLAPYLTMDGELELRLDDDGLHLCPLVRAGDMAVLDGDFVYGAGRAWDILLTDPLIRCDVWWQSRMWDDRKDEPWQHLLRE